MSIVVDTISAPQNTDSDSFPEVSLTKWVNMNIRMGSNTKSNYTLVNGWQGDNWYEIDPSLKVLLPYCTNYNDTSITMKSTAASIGVYWTEMRVYLLDENKAWGVY